MKKWEVTLLIAATHTVTVQAETEEEAKEEAHQNAYVSLCHRCSDELEVGDPMEVTGCRLVENEDEDED